ncbi:MAG: polyketide cyclase, partial [Marmoricola sp.]|nr:polyketide cyclase [Marmoricola sp.]
EPTTDGGTRVVQRREAPKGISDVSVRLTKTVLGGLDEFTTELRQGMNQTLARIKADAER